MAIANVRLDDKYALEKGRVYLTGIQALVRLPLMQRARDVANGLNTAGFISGYRGSPLGGFDQALWQAKAFLDEHHVLFKPAVNEDLGATAVWGSQQVNLWQGARVDGVFGMWYGKGPGVDRTGDVFKHANAAGSARYGGVLAVAGDDHGCKSSTLPSQCEYSFMDAGIPVLNPADVQDVLDLGLMGWALSRYCGCWVGFKIIADTADASASVAVDPERVRIHLPKEFTLPEDGLNIRWPDRPMTQESRLHRDKIAAALAFARSNGLDRTIIAPERPRLGLVTTGKAYLDVLQALADLGIDEREARHLGIALYKVAMPWPLEPQGVRAFASGLEELLVVEEKRGVIEDQIRSQLYECPDSERPRIIGKRDERGDWLLPSTGELDAAVVTEVIASRLCRFHDSAALQRRLRAISEARASAEREPTLLERVPHFCSGCPHNTSTRVPEGSRAVAGIGCHYMATWMDRETETFTHMGGEGVTWVGQAPFTEQQHVFANLGDGTYFHSGLMAIRAAISAGVNITYKILYNDAVAMTGGQHVDGELSVPEITHQLAAEGVAKTVIVTDEPEKYDGVQGIANGVTVHHRRELDALQRALRETPGCTALIYDQTCAAEKRRRRKRGIAADPPKRAFINQRVCEGCGDCNAKSNCLSVIPRETEFGRKRAIDQQQCNKDFSCVDGFCPSFVTVHGGELRRPEGVSADTPFEVLPEPRRPSLERPFNLLITGVGGTGVVTIGALLGMAAHLEGRGVGVLDMTGLAQKYGAVVSHVRVGADPDAVHGPRIPLGEADVLLGCDLVVAAGADTLSRLDPKRAAAVVNTHRVMPSGFTRDPDLPFPTDGMSTAIERHSRDGASHFLDATRLAEGLLGDAIMANLFMVGFAYQQGLIPLSADAIDRAIELNGVAVEANRLAFLWGRRAAHDRRRVEHLASPAQAEPDIAETLDEVIRRRRDYLVDYQDERYAQRYEALVERVRAVEAQRLPTSQALTETVARYYFKLLAYKDEYEVARLYTDGDFERELRETFNGDFKLELHLAPPILARVDPATGEPRKRAYGPWIFKLFRVLAKMKHLRGTALDVFAYTADRKLERQLLRDYEALVAELIEGLETANHGYAVELAGLPEHIRGYGHVKAAAVEKARARQAELLALFRHPPRRVAA